MNKTKEIQTLVYLYQNNHDENIRRNARNRLVKSGYYKKCELCHGKGKILVDAAFQSGVDEAEISGKSTVFIEEKKNIKKKGAKYVICRSCDGTGKLLDYHAISETIGKKVI